MVNTISKHRQKLFLALSQGTKTRQEMGHNVTVDLVMISPELEDKIIICGLRSELDHDSDHIPIATILDTPQCQTQRTRQWRKTDIKKLKDKCTKALSDKVGHEGLQDTQGIDAEAYRIVQSIQQAIKESIPMA